MHDLRQDETARGVHVDIEELHDCLEHSISHHPAAPPPDAASVAGLGPLVSVPEAIGGVRAEDEALEHGLLLGSKSRGDVRASPLERAAQGLPAHARQVLPARPIPSGG